MILRTTGSARGPPITKDRRQYMPRDDAGVADRDREEDQGDEAEREAVARAGS
jgi:hypothetical protein